jgi:RNA recognition motif-containing protein
MNVRLPEDNGRLRGFGYVQFETREALIDALSMSEEVCYLLLYHCFSFVKCTHFHDFGMQLYTFFQNVNYTL